MGTTLVTAKIDSEHGWIEGTQIDITASKILTAMEKKVLSFIMSGKSNKEIAKILNRSIRTIEDHRSRIMHKMGASNIVELTQKVSADPNCR